VHQQQGGVGAMFWVGEERGDGCRAQGDEKKRPETERESYGGARQRDTKADESADCSLRPLCCLILKGH